MKKRIRIVMVISIAIFIAFAFGCNKSNAGQKAKNEGMTIKWISQGTGPTGWETKTRPILEEFEKETGIQVETEFYSFADLFDVIETRSAVKSSDFDVMSVDVTYVAKYGSSGYLEPLDKYFSAEEKAKWDTASYSAGVWDNVMYAAPENTSTQELYYNKTLLEKAGITLPENGPDNRLSYQEVADLARRVLDRIDPNRKEGYIGFDFQQVSRVYQMNMLANSMGGKQISSNGMSLDGVVNTQPWINAMTWYQDLVKSGITSRGYTTDQLSEQFYTGKVIFMIGGTWTSNNMRVNDVIGSTYAPWFKGYEKFVATSTGSWYFGVNANSQKKEKAAEFVKFFTLGKGNDMWLKINGDVPSRLDKQQEIISSPDASSALKIAAYEAANTAYPRAVTPVFGEYSSVLNQAWEDVRNGADVKTTLNNAVSQFNALVAAYK